MLFAEKNILILTNLLANSADDKLVIFFLIFPRKQDLTFHAKLIAWNAKSCFLGKIRKIIQYVVCWKFSLECSAIRSGIQLNGLPFQTDLICRKPLIITQTNFTIWAETFGNVLLTCALNPVSDQPAHPRSLIRVFVVRIETLCIGGYPKCAKFRFWS